jgi:ATP-dependent DNA helicase RecQ
VEFSSATVQRERLQHDQDLFEQLRLLRLKLAGERGVPPFIIFHDRVLIEMATFFPRTPEEFVKINGVGEVKTAKYASLFLPVIQAYCESNPVVLSQKPAPGTTQSTPPAGKTRTETIWKQYQAGETIESIAADLGFTTKTILKHLQRAHEAGKPLRLDGLKAFSQLSIEDEKRVIQVFDRLGIERLRPVFDVLGGVIPYDQLHIWRLIYVVMAEEA